jgi:mannosyltransferase OCH1-like enzyme
MKRDEEIARQADKYTDNSSNYAEWSDDGGWSDTNDIDLIEKAFESGAKWADETMIERAVNWLVHNMASGEYLGLYDTIIKPDFITKFKKAMKGEKP